MLLAETGSTRKEERLEGGQWWYQQDPSNAQVSKERI